MESGPGEVTESLLEFCPNFRKGTAETAANAAAPKPNFPRKLRRVCIPLPVFSEPDVDFFAIIYS